MRNSPSRLFRGLFACQSQVRDLCPFVECCFPGPRRHTDMPIPNTTGEKQPVLYNHKPLTMNKDDYDRACQIPKKKVGVGAGSLVMSRDLCLLLRWV